jgi:hypothetical protein
MHGMSNVFMVHDYKTFNLFYFSFYIIVTLLDGIPSFKKIPFKFLVPQGCSETTIIISFPL